MESRNKKREEKKGFAPQIFLSFEPYLFIAHSSVGSGAAMKLAILEFIHSTVESLPFAMEFKSSLRMFSREKKVKNLCNEVKLYWISLDFGSNLGFESLK